MEMYAKFIPANGSKIAPIHWMGMQNCMNCKLLETPIARSTNSYNWLSSWNFEADNLDKYRTTSCHFRALFESLSKKKHKKLPESPYCPNPPTHPFNLKRQETALHAKEGLSSSLAQPSKALPGLKPRHLENPKKGNLFQPWFSREKNKIIFRGVWKIII